MLKMRDTCLGCTERQVGCHGSCEKYLGAKAELEAVREIIKTNKAQEKDMDALKNRRIQRARRRKKRYGQQGY